jgi:hypothetical protein
MPEQMRAQVPVGAHLTMGKKGPSGAPVNVDRWRLAAPVADGKGRQQSKPDHPDHVGWSSPSVEVEVVALDWPDALTHDRVAYRLPSVGGRYQHPPDGDSRPWCSCSGDSDVATRWTVGEDGTAAWREMACARDLCPIAQKGACKLTSRLLCVPIIDGKRGPLTLLTSRGWESGRRLHGVREALDRAHLGLLRLAHGLPGDVSYREALAQTGEQPYPVAGLRLTLTIAMKSTGTRRYPVIVASMAQDPTAWLLGQQARVQQLRETYRAPGLGSVPHRLEDYGDGVLLGGGQ